MSTSFLFALLLIAGIAVIGVIVAVAVVLLLARSSRAGSDG